MQFRNQMKEIKSQAVLSGVRATEYFRYLPSCGIIPITADFVNRHMKKYGSQVTISLGTEKGFVPDNFFEGITCRDPVFVEGAKLHALLHQSLCYPPADLNSKEMVWLYFVRENIESLAKQGQSQPYLIFTTGHMPYHGSARYDLARWDNSNYASI